MLGQQEQGLNVSCVKLDSVPAVKKGIILAFDLDNTLLTANISFLFGKELYNRGLISIWAVIVSLFVWLLHQTGIVSSRCLHRCLFSFLFQDIDKSVIDIIIQEKFPQLLLSDKRITLFRKSLLNEIEEMRIGAGEIPFHVVVLSSSPDFLVGRCVDVLQRQLAQNIWAWKSSKYEVDSSNHFRRVTYVMSGREKVEELEKIQEELKAQAHVDQWVTFGYSDSVRDFLFLRAVNYPVCVAPSFLLRGIAFLMRWRVIKE